MMLQDERPGSPPGDPPEQLVLLVEDDDGDALLVQELLQDVSAPVAMRWVRSLGEAKPLLAGVTCALLDLGLPDSRGLDGLRWLQEHAPRVPVVVLTGLADEHLGAAAVRAGAQDYLVKGQVDGPLLHRVIRYAAERQQAEGLKQQLHEARIYAAENARLERGLLPSPLLADERLTVATRYWPGGQRMLLGGDFYDVVETTDGWVHALIGDVSGRGPDEAALGVCLRVAWRTMVLAGRPDAEVLAAVQQVLGYERQHDRTFTTLCMLSVAPGRADGRLHLAGHPLPLLITSAGVRELTAPVCLPLGVLHTLDWPSSDVVLGDSWSVLLYTDGLIEGRVGAGPERLGSEGLISLIEAALPAQRPTSSADRQLRDQMLLGTVIDQVRELNGGGLDDDLAALVLGFSPQARP